MHPTTSVSCGFHDNKKTTTTTNQTIKQTKQANKQNTHLRISLLKLLSAQFSLCSPYISFNFLFFPLTFSSFLFFFFPPSYLCFSPDSANDLALDGKRKTISAADVVTAMQEIDFPQFLDQMNETLEGWCVCVLCVCVCVLCVCVCCVCCVCVCCVCVCVCVCVCMSM